MKNVKDYYKLLVRLEDTINEGWDNFITKMFLANDELYFDVCKLIKKSKAETVGLLVSALLKEMEECEKSIGLQHFNLSIDDIVEMAQACANAAALCHNNCNIDPNKIDTTDYGAEQIRDILCDYLKEIIEVE